MAVGQARVRPNFSYKDAILSPSAATPPSLLSPWHKTLSATHLLPPLPPLSLLNPSLRGRCFRCFERGHLAACCREPQRCLLCMRFGHSASLCKRRHTPLHPAWNSGVSRPAPAVARGATSTWSSLHRRNMANPRCSSTTASRHQPMEPGPSSSRPSAATIFLPCPPSLQGNRLFRVL